MSRQGSSLLRFLLVEAAQVAVRRNPDWRSQFRAPYDASSTGLAMVAMARKLAVHLYWIWL